MKNIEASSLIPIVNANNNSNSRIKNNFSSKKSYTDLMNAKKRSSGNVAILESGEKAAK